MTTWTARALLVVLMTGGGLTGCKTLPGRAEQSSVEKDMTPAERVVQWEKNSGTPLLGPNRLEDLPPGSVSFK